MSKVVLDYIQGGYNLSQINDNFARIVDELNERVLYRDNPSQENNQLESDIDFNKRVAYNIGQLYVDSGSTTLSESILADAARILQEVTQIRDSFSGFTIADRAPLPEEGNDGDLWYRY